MGEPVSMRRLDLGRSQRGLDLWERPRAWSSLATTQISVSFPFFFKEPTRKGLAQGKPRRSAHAPSRAAPGPPRGEEMAPTKCLPLPLVGSMT